MLRQNTRFPASSAFATAPSGSSTTSGVKKRVFLLYRRPIVPPCWAQPPTGGRLKRNADTRCCRPPKLPQTSLRGRKTQRSGLLSSPSADSTFGELLFYSALQQGCTDDVFTVNTCSCWFAGSLKPHMIMRTRSLWWRPQHARPPAWPPARPWNSPPMQENAKL